MKESKLNKRDVQLAKRKGHNYDLFINYSDLLKRLATELGILKLNKRFSCAYNFEQNLQPTSLISIFIIISHFFFSINT